MKKRILISASVSIALCASVFSSCTKQEEPLAPASEKNGNLTITFVEEPLETKTEFYDKTIRWKAGDKVAFMQYAKVNGTNTYKGYYITVASSTTSLSTTITGFNTPDEDTDSYYLSVFPNENYSSYNLSALLTGTGLARLWLTIPSTQTPVVTDGVPTSFDPKADLLLSSIKENLEKNANGYYTIRQTYYRKVAIGKMTIKNLPSDSPITAIEITAVKDGSNVVLAGKHTYNVQTGELSTAAGAETVITLDYSANPVALVLDPNDNAKKMVAHFCCQPFTLGENDYFCIKVTTEAGEVFTKYSVIGEGKDLKFEADKGTQFTVDMSSAITPSSWIHTSEYNSGNYVKTATKVYCLVSAETNQTIPSAKFAIIPESTFCNPSFNIAEYLEAYGTDFSDSALSSLNEGYSIRCTAGNLAPDTWHVAIFKFVAGEGADEVVGYTYERIKTDWFSMTNATRDAGGISFRFYGTGIVSSSKHYRVIKTDALPEGQTFEQYYTNTLAPGGLNTNTLNAINANGYSGVGYYALKYYTGKSTQADMTPGTSYTVMIKVTNERGETKFCYASANAGGTTE